MNKGIEYRVVIEHDIDPESPRDWDNLGTMACWHGRYQLGDEQPSFSPTEHMLDLIEAQSEGFSERLDRRCERRFKLDCRESERECMEYRKEQIEEAFDSLYISLPLFLYDHSGITMNTKGFHCPWDSGQVGFIYVTRERLRDEHGWSRITKKRRSWVEYILRGEVETYDQFLRGDVYGYTVESRPKQTSDADGGWEQEDSCWGFYGSDPRTNGMLENIDEELHDLLLEAA